MPVNFVYEGPRFDQEEVATEAKAKAKATCESDLDAVASAWVSSDLEDEDEVRSGGGVLSSCGGGKTHGFLGCKIVHLCPPL